jgi:hypothetical protein
VVSVPPREWERSTIHSFVQLQSVFRIRDPVAGASLTPGSEIRGVSNQDPDPRSGLKIPDHISEILETVFGLKKLKFFDADKGSGIFWSGMEKFGSGINIPDPQSHPKVSLRPIALYISAHTDKHPYYINNFSR